MELQIAKTYTNVGFIVDLVDYLIDSEVCVHTTPTAGFMATIILVDGVQMGAYQTRSIPTNISP